MNDCDVISGPEALSFDSYNTNMFEYFLDPSTEPYVSHNASINMDFINSTESNGMDQWVSVDTVEGSGVVAPTFYPGVKAENISPNGIYSDGIQSNSEPTSPDHDTNILQSLGDNILLAQQNLVNSGGSSDDIELGLEDLDGDDSDEMFDDLNEHYMENENEHEQSVRLSRKRKAGSDGQQKKRKGAASSRDLEPLNKQMQGKRPTSNDEEQLFKRQRRLIKNRESAQKSRLRKKKYVEELELKVKSYADLNSRLIEENKNLKEDVGYLATIVRKTPNISNEVLKGVARRPAFSTANAKAAGVCLLLVLFSFGLFCNTKGVGTATSFPQVTYNQTQMNYKTVPQHTMPTKGGSEVDEVVQHGQEVDTEFKFSDQLEEEAIETGLSRGQTEDKEDKVFRQPNKRRKIK